VHEALLMLLMSLMGQIPPDLVVKYEAIEIIDVIL
jgi:hypothetical protein